MKTPTASASVLLAAATVCSASAAPQENQFDDPPPGFLAYPITLDSTDSTTPPLEQVSVNDFVNVGGELVNFETQLIKPIAFLENGSVAVANEPNGTLEIFSADLVLERYFVLGHGICSIAERIIPAVGKTPADSELWVTVRHQQAIAVIRTSDWKLTHWVRADVDELGIGYGAADHPGQVVFGANDKAYATSFHTDSLVVFNALTKVHEETIPLVDDHHQSTPAMNTPYSLVAGDTHVYVVSHHSGNQTTAREVTFGGDTEPGPYQSPDTTVTVVQLGLPSGDPLHDPGTADWALPDFDVIKVSMSSHEVDEHFKNVGTTNFNILRNDTTGELWVTGMDARNGEFIGERSWAGGRVVRNRVTIIDESADPDDTHVVVSTDDRGPAGDIHVAQPTDITMDTLGRVWIAGYSSDNLGVFDQSGNWIGAVDTDSGPRGLAVSPAGKLYVLSRGYNRVLRYDVSKAVLPTQAELSVDLVDPTPEIIKSGRRHFLTAVNSGDGTASCASCHVDARKDGLSWDLSDYHDEGSGFTWADPPKFWKDKKGTMVTQDLRGLPEVGALHWRGEQEELKDFNGAFEGLLHGTELNNQEFTHFEEYIHSLAYPANFGQKLNRTSSPGALQFAAGTGLGNGVTQDCTACHRLPYGSNNDLSSLKTSGFHQVSGGLMSRLVPRVAQWRAGVFKEVDVCDASDESGVTPVPVTGFGFFHAGNHNNIGQDIAAIINNIFPALDLETLMIVPEESEGRIAYLREFDTGMAPAAHYSELLNASNYASNRIDFMIDQANRKNCDLVGRGHLDFSFIDQDVGLWWDRDTQRFVLDDSSFSDLTSADVHYLIQNGNLEVLLFGTPLHAGKRLGLDLDRDGLYDRNEVLAGLDPLNPDSDGDGLWDGYDDDPGAPSSPPAGTIDISDLKVEVVTTSTVKLSWETSELSPTAVLYGERRSNSFGSYEGDSYPIPLNPNTSKNWRKRHSVFLRGLRADMEFQFRVLTQAQNGSFGQSDTYYFRTDADNTTAHQPQIEAEQLTLDSTLLSGSTREWTATVLITDPDGTPLPNVEVSGYFIHFDASVDPTRDAVGPMLTNASGIATLTSTFDGQTAGHRTEFVIPENFFVSGIGWILPVRTQGMIIGDSQKEFAWPESAATTIVKYVQ